MSAIKIKTAVQAPAPQDLKKQFRDVATLYEKQFLGEMVKAMRNTVTRSQFTEPSMAQKIYEGKMDEQYVEAWGDQGGIGLSDLIYGQLMERYGGLLEGVEKPKGPIPLENRELPIFEEGSKSFRIDGQGSPEKGAQVFIRGRSDVVSPWAGEVGQAFESEGGRQTFKISHKGLESTLSFVGDRLQIQTGDRIASGQKLGRIQGEGLTWKLTRLGS